MVGGSSFFQFLPLPFASWAVWLEFCGWSQYGWEKVIEYLKLLLFLAYQVSFFLSREAPRCPSLLFITNIHLNAFLFALDILGHV